MVSRPSDDVILDVPDTEANAAAFGYSESGTHAIVDARLGEWAMGERELAEPILDALEDDMLILADRGFYSSTMWRRAAGTGAQLLWRVPESLRLPVEKVLPDGTYLSRIRSRSAIHAGRKPHPDDIWIRVIEYDIPGRGAETEIFTLITTLTDPNSAPAAELAALYAERWKLETTFTEIETRQLISGRPLRSQSPAMVRQEAWGIPLAHYALRHFMAEAAEEADADPDRLSFIRSLRVTRRSITDQAAFPPLQCSRKRHVTPWKKYSSA